MNWTRAGQVVTVLVTAVLLAGASGTDKRPTGPFAPRVEGAPRIEMGQGHLKRDAKAFHYWDKEKEIPAVCARCHAANGVAQYLKEGKNTPAPHVKNAFACTNCHADMLTYERQRVEKVTFPSGLSVDSGDNDSNLCMTCHQGRESTASVNKAIDGMAPDTPNPKLGFVHVHYYPVGATKYGTEAKVGYEYAGKTYAGRWDHPRGILKTCTSCHEPHTGEIKAEKCAGCHTGARGGFFSRPTVDKYKRELYAGIQEYARSVGGASIAFSPDAYPYWYTDTNGNGVVDREELRPDNAYKAYTPRLVQAVYNMSYALRDPAASSHNAPYVTQLLYDSLESLAQSGKAGVSMSGKARPGRETEKY
jgi:hypothetical protein